MKQIISKRNRSLLAEMVRTDFKLRYQASVLGYVWSLIKPLFTFLILYVIFGVILKLGKEPNFAMSLLLGIVLWSFFAEATAQALRSVVGKGSLIRKIAIPRAIIPVASVASAFINMILSLGIVFIFVIFRGDNALSWWTLLVFPLLIIELILFTTAISYFLAAIYVRFRDIDHIWEVVRQALFYTIPIIYPLSLIPDGLVQKIIILNPLVQIIQDARAVTTYSGVLRVEDIYHSGLIVLFPIALSIILFIWGVKFYNKRSKYFAEQV